MRLRSTAIAFFVLLVLSACTSVKVSQDFDPRADLSHYGSWQWRHPIQPPTGDIRVDNALQDQRIRQAVSDHFSKRNIDYTDSHPDLYLSYHLIIEQKIQSDTYHTTVRLGRYYRPWYGGLGTETRIQQYDQSRLTIDIHTVATGRLVWRGVGTYRRKDYKRPQDAAVAMQKIVDQILMQFPPVNSSSSLSSAPPLHR